jgi:hypothetical protein
MIVAAMMSVERVFVLDMKNYGERSVVSSHCTTTAKGTAPLVLHYTVLLRRKVLHWYCTLCSIYYGERYCTIGTALHCTTTAKGNALVLHTVHYTTERTILRLTQYTPTNTLYSY